MPEPGAGSLVGPISIIGGALVLLTRLLVGLERERRTLPGLECVLLSYLAMLLFGGVAYALVRGDAVTLVLFVVRSGLSPFLVIAAILAGVAGLVFATTVRSRDAGASRPLWPWERPGRDGNRGPRD